MLLGIPDVMAACRSPKPFVGVRVSGGTPSLLVKVKLTKMKDIFSMFSIPLIQMECVNWVVKKQQLLNLPKKLTKIDSIETDFHSYKNNSNFINNEEIKTIFKDELDYFMRTINISNLELTSSWFEKSTLGSSHSVHSHGITGYSSVCYINYDENCHSPLTFLAPYRNFLDGDDLFYTPTNIKEGTILFFPSAILHYAPLNETTTERLVVSFNLNLY